MKLILVRHGATEWSASGRHTGLTDLALTEVGVAQAQAVQTRVLGLIAGEFSVWSSPLQRARKTAEIVFPAQPYRVDERLREFNYGDYEGLTTPQIRVGRPGWTVWDGCPGGETWQAVAARVDSFLHDLPEKSTNVIVAHGHLLRILGARSIGQLGDFGRHLSLDTASVSLIDDFRDGTAIVHWNA